MNTKLTLTIEQAVIEKAKRYAKQNERSLSKIIENYLKTLITNDLKEEKMLSPIVKSLKGSFSKPKNFDYKKELSERLSEKHIH